MQLTESFLLKEYQNIKKQAKKATQDNRFNKALNLYKYAGKIAWEYPIIPQFIDEDIEHDLKSITEKSCPAYKFTPDISHDRIVYYCSWLGDNGALVEQYLDYFASSEFNVLIIVPDKKETRMGPTIIQKIKSTKNVQLFIPKSKNILNKINEIRVKIQLVKPYFAFQHFWPNDVIGFSIFCDLTMTKRFFINHGDHIYWFGKNCADYFIEYRKFGIALSVYRRGININNILHIPFYPINNQSAFSGFHFDPKEKIIGIGGANLYKYYLDKNLTYFKIIADLLTKNKNFIFLLCGAGNPDKIIDMIKKADVENRFFYLGKRKDYYSLIGKCNILFESYPFRGGLTMLFAIEQKIPVIGITSDYNSSGSIQDFLGISNYKEPINFKEFYYKANLLIQSKKERNNLVEILSNNNYNKKAFTTSVDSLIKEDYHSLRYKNDDLSLHLIDEKCLQDHLHLPDANLASLFRKKLFILKKHLSITERLKIVLLIVKNNQVKNFRNMIRLLLLGVIGR
ncbi:MAG: hypothetical protein KAT68_10525 [Bacteroidales bacterium]|nr:hypothetical protein [Bacteroidales bacterium]